MLVLASQSPRRRELLTQIGVRHRVLAADVDESVRPGEAPDAYVSRVARAKAEAGWQAAGARGAVLAADTAVVLDAQILGKPADRDDALHMLGALSGRDHRVLTAVALRTAQGLRATVVETRVWFRSLTPAEIVAYWDSGEPRDKAGAYGIQGRGAVFVARIEGSYSGVVGLPLCETWALLRDAGIE